MSSKWRQTLIHRSATVRDAVETLNNVGLKICLVYDQVESLYGVVTDGDIRRGLLAGVNLDSPIEEIVNKSPLVATPKASKVHKIELLHESQFFCIPIVGESGRILGLDLLADLIEKRSRTNTVFIMAGGFGKRLKPLTDNCPKPLLKVGEKPILELIIERFLSFGFKNFYFSLYYLPEQIKDYFGDGSKWDINIRYVQEEVPLGTGGALSLLPPEHRQEPVVLMNGDLLTKVNFDHLLDYHNISAAELTMGVREYEYKVPYGVVEHVGGNVIDIIEKPVHRSYINAGIYVLNPSVINSVSPKEYLDMTSLMKNLIQQGKGVDMFPIHEYWVDIGKFPDLERANNEYATYFKRENSNVTN